MKTTLAMLVGALLVAGCGPDRSNDRMNVDGMWSSTEGVLSCAGATPEPFGDLQTCTWECVEIDGITYPQVMLTFARDAGATDWHLESVYREVGTCSP